MGLDNIKRAFVTGLTALALCWMRSSAQKKGDNRLAAFVIVTFATIFIVGILWATSRKAEEHEH
jgi:hypothetical protein